MPTHKINKDIAVELIKNFLNDPVLGSIGKNRAIGGVLDLNSPRSLLTISESALITGWAFWYCWNTEEPEFPPFFLAYETNTYDGDPTHTIIQSAELKRSHENYIFQYSNRLPVTTEQVKAFLENPPRWENDKEGDVAISNNDVGELTIKFLNDFPNAATANVYNDYAFGFFMGGEIDELIEEGSYVRYYFGYESESEQNTIRIILIPTDETGNNIIGAEIVMLEQSWPPSPAVPIAMVMGGDTI